MKTDSGPRFAYAGPGCSKAETLASQLPATADVCSTAALRGGVEQRSVRLVEGGQESTLLGI